MVNWGKRKFAVFKGFRKGWRPCGMHTAVSTKTYLWDTSNVSLINTNIQEWQVKLLALLRSCGIFQGWYWIHRKLSWKPIMNMNFWKLFIHLDFSACDVIWGVYHKLGIYYADCAQKTHVCFLVFGQQKNQAVLKSWLCFLRSRRVTHNFFPSHFSGTLLSEEY